MFIMAVPAVVRVVGRVVGALSLLADTLVSVSSVRTRTAPIPRYGLQ